MTRLDAEVTLSIAFKLIVAAEGGDRFTNDPRDPGGATKYGVSWRAVRLRDVDKDGRLDFDLDRDGDVDEADIRQVTEEIARGLFRADYWNPCRCELLPPAIAVALVDAAYNQGPRTAVSLLQKAIGARADGIVGSATVQAAESLPRQMVLQHFAGYRADRYRQHPQADTFFRGWMNRLFDLQLRLEDLFGKRK